MNFLGSKWRHVYPFIGWCMVIFFTHWHRALADEDSNVEYKVKAGYLYNFTKFVTWPEDSSNTFNICILGSNPFGHLLDPIEQKTAFGHPIKLFHVTDAAPGQRCHILYIGPSTEKTIPITNALTINDGNSQLTVGEHKSFIEQGGMINFVNRGGKIKLQINLQKLKQSGLTISSKLLEVAELIGDEHD